MACLYGDGAEGEVLSLIRGFLRESMGKFKEKNYGRIIRFKTGLASSIILVYNRSDSTFKICGDERVLEKLRNYVYTYRRRVKVYDYPAAQIRIGGGIEDQLSELLIERQGLKRRIRACRRLIYMIPLYVLIAGLVLWFITTNIIDTVIAGVLVGIILFLIPHPIMGTGGIESCRILRLGEYVEELGVVERELRRLVDELPEDHPLREIVARQLED